ncbi:MAG: type II secretion system protein [Candidatus Omnitrophica bacterium]|nr:type II secretion system protein [Candidatus Omnitrophota bacterium]
MKNKSFTLIELIMVIVIIGILASMAIPKFINLRRDAQIAACSQSLGAIRTALGNYYARYAIDQTAQFPASLDATFAADYFSERILPTHPNPSVDWNDYYTTSIFRGVVTAYTMTSDPVCTSSI